MGRTLSNVCLFYVCCVERAGELDGQRRRCWWQGDLRSSSPLAEVEDGTCLSYLSVGRACLGLLDEHSVLCV